MAVFRVERTRDYTVMSNLHLRDKRLSLKAKGLLSQMLSLPENWDYTLAGLAHINRESKDAIRSAVNELERTGYIQRRQTTDERGQFGSNEYIIYEKPVQPVSALERPMTEKPSSEKPTTEETAAENPTQLNINPSRKNQSKTDRQTIDSFLPDNAPQDEKGSEGTAEMEQYRELILESIEYQRLMEERPGETDQINEIVELMLEVVCAKRKTTRVAGTDFPHEVVRSRFLKLNGEHIRFVLDCMKENTTKVRNIKQYLLTVLYNAPTTITSYYSALVNHDLYRG